ncbi:MAG: FecR domain-containing protein [Planctomycetes bacterium]|nr:FecR domain-containing protein [Planctomycetota bacterium]
MDTICPESNRLGAYIEGSLAGRPRERFEVHLRTCGECLSAVAWNVRVGKLLAAPARRWRVPSAIAAAVLAGLGFVAWREGRWSAASVRLTGPGGTEVALVSGDEIGAGRGGILRMQDGTTVSVQGEASLRLLAPCPGERLRLRMEAGEAGFDVLHGERGVVVETPRGTARVLGTRFRVRLWPGFPRSGGGVLEVSVEEGRVRVASPEGVEVVAYAGTRAFIPAGGRPLLEVMTPRTDPSAVRPALDLFVGSLRRGDPSGAALALVFLRNLGEPACAAARERFLDRSRPATERAEGFVLWREIDPAGAREALSRVDPHVEPDLAAALSSWPAEGW